MVRENVMQAELLLYLAAGAAGFLLGFTAACLWFRKVMRTWERAYEVATAEHRALYEQRTDGVDVPRGGEHG